MINIDYMYIRSTFVAGAFALTVAWACKSYYLYAILFMFGSLLTAVIFPSVLSFIVTCVVFVGGFFMINRISKQKDKGEQNKGSEVHS